MRHQVRKKQFGRHTAHRESMFRNMVTSLIQEERITTTLPKAKELRRLAEQMITLGKEGTLHARRQAAAIVRSRDGVKKLFADLATRFGSRQGGYTRILKLGYRHGDGAPMALIEYLGYEPKKAATKEAEKSEKSKEAKVTKPKAKKPAAPKKVAAKKEKETKKEAEA